MVFIVNSFDIYQPMFEICIQGILASVDSPTPMTTLICNISCNVIFLLSV